MRAPNSSGRGHSHAVRPRGARPQLKRDPLGGDIKLSTPFRVLPGLPPYGAPAIPCPRQWGHRGGEGFVVAFNAPGAEWVGNFGRGLSSKDAALAHPDGHRVLVIAVAPFMKWTLEEPSPSM